MFTLTHYRVIIPNSLLGLQTLLIKIFHIRSWYLKNRYIKILTEFVGFLPLIHIVTACPINDTEIITWNHFIVDLQKLLTFGIGFFKLSCNFLITQNYYYLKLCDNAKNIIRNYVLLRFSIKCETLSYFISIHHIRC